MNNIQTRHSEYLAFLSSAHVSKSTAISRQGKGTKFVHELDVLAYIILALFVVIRVSQVVRVGRELGGQLVRFPTYAEFCV